MTSADLTVPPLYADRDPEALGEHYTKHLYAMTNECLYDKAPIAAELAWRDQQIASLQARLDAAERSKAELLEALQALMGADFEDNEGFTRFIDDVAPAYATSKAFAAIANADAATQEQTP